MIFTLIWKKGSMTSVIAILEFNRKEIELFREYPDEYGYAFYIFRKNANK